MSQILIAECYHRNMYLYNSYTCGTALVWIILLFIAFLLCPISTIKWITMFGMMVSLCTILSQVRSKANRVVPADTPTNSME